MTIMSDEEIQKTINSDEYINNLRKTAIETISEVTANKDRQELALKTIRMTDNLIKTKFPESASRLQAYFDYSKRVQEETCRSIDYLCLQLLGLTELHEVLSDYLAKRSGVA